MWGGFLKKPDEMIKTRLRYHLSDENLAHLMAIEGLHCIMCVCVCMWFLSNDASLVCTHIIGAETTRCRCTHIRPHPQSEFDSLGVLFIVQKTAPRVSGLPPSPFGREQHALIFVGLLEQDAVFFNIMF